MATIKDVAARAGVSPSTVSRVLANSPRISEPTTLRVREALDVLNYHPNAFARGLVTNTAGAIGILIPPEPREFFGNPFFAEMMSGVSEVAQEAGLDTVLSTAGRQEVDAFEAMVRSRRVDGVLVLRSRRNDPLLAKVACMNVPATLLGRPDRDWEIPYVNNDNVKAAYAATLHLLRMGHRRVGFLGGADDLVVTMDRVDGYRKALSDEGIVPDQRMEVSSFFLEQGGYLGMMRLLALSDRPTAVLASDDVLAFGAMRAASELGYRIPDDLAIVGFNDIRLAELANPALTSVRIHMPELGKAAAELLIDQIRRGQRDMATRILPTELVIRNSCGAKRGNQIFS